MDVDGGSGDDLVSLNSVGDVGCLTVAESFADFDVLASLGDLRSLRSFDSFVVDSSDSDSWLTLVEASGED